MGRPAVVCMSATCRSSQPELSPRGAETRRRVRPFDSSPAGTPVCRSSRSIRPWADTSRRPAPPATRSKSSPGSIALTRSCHRDPSSRGSRSRTAKSGRSTSPPSCSGVSSSGGIGLSAVPAYPFGEKLQPSTDPANAGKSGSHGSGSPSGRNRLSATHARSRRCPSGSRGSTAPARTTAGADTTRPVGRTKPIHSRWASIWGSRFGIGYVGAVKAMGLAISRFDAALRDRGRPS